MSYSSLGTISCQTRRWRVNRSNAITHHGIHSRSFRFWPQKKNTFFIFPWFWYLLFLTHMTALHESKLRWKCRDYGTRKKEHQLLEWTTKNQGFFQMLPTTKVCGKIVTKSGPIVWTGSDLLTSEQQKMRAICWENLPSTRIDVSCRSAQLYHQVLPRGSIKHMDKCHFWA